MTKNNGFKKTIRAYMETYNVSYSEARKSVDEVSYLQGTGSITLIIGGSGTGKTIQLRELLKNQSLLTAVILAPHEDIDSFRTTHYVESVPHLIDEVGRHLCVDAIQAKKNFQNLVDQKKYSTFAIDGIDYLAHQGEKYLLDTFPRKADLILTFQFHVAGEDFIAEVLERLDDAELSRQRLSQRVKVIKNTTLDTYDVSKNREDRFSVRDYYL